MTVTSIRFNDKQYDEIKKMAEFYGLSVTTFMRNAILERLEDELDYNAAIQSERESNGITHSRESILKELGLSDD